MSPTSAITSLRFALQRELLKLYFAIFLGFSILDVIQGAFAIIDLPLLRQLVKLPFALFGWALVAGGIVGIVHFVLAETTVRSTSR
jgi:polyferredoxin